MAAALALHVRNLPDYDKQLHVLYLTNDILLKRYAALPMHLVFLSQTLFVNSQYTCTRSRHLAVGFAKPAV